MSRSIMATWSRPIWWYTTSRCIQRAARLPASAFVLRMEPTGTSFRGFPRAVSSCSSPTICHTHRRPWINGSLPLPSEETTTTGASRFSFRLTDYGQPSSSQRRDWPSQRQGLCAICRCHPKRDRCRLKILSGHATDRLGDRHRGSVWPSGVQRRQSLHSDQKSGRDPDHEDRFGRRRHSQRYRGDLQARPRGFLHTGTAVCAHLYPTQFRGRGLDRSDRFFLIMANEIEATISVNWKRYTPALPANGAILRSQSSLFGMAKVKNFTHSVWTNPLDSAEGGPTGTVGY